MAWWQQRIGLGCKRKHSFEKHHDWLRVRQCYSKGSDELLCKSQTEHVRTVNAARMAKGLWETLADVLLLLFKE